MNRLFVYLFLFIFLTLSNGESVFAQELAAGSSAELKKAVNEKTPDSRVLILKGYLEKYNSPLIPFAQDFVEIADKYDLDWKLVAAISGVESTFGQQIPYESFNGWGWGVYGTNVIKFSSWQEGIETVSEGLRTNYIDKWKAKDVWEIGKIYASSPTWAQRVIYFMNSIEEYKRLNLANKLSLSL